jgi:hypothetical protein
MLSNFAGLALQLHGDSFFYIHNIVFLNIFETVCFLSLEPQNKRHYHFFSCTSNLGVQMASAMKERKSENA